MAIVAGSAGLVIARQGDDTGSTSPSVELTSRQSRGFQVGVKFTPTQPAALAGIHYFDSGSADGYRSATLWTSDGQVLAKATADGSLTRGWHTATLSSAVALKPGTSYVITYSSPSWPVTDPKVIAPLPAGALDNVSLQASFISRGQGFPQRQFKVRATAVLPALGTVAAPSPTPTATHTTVAPTPGPTPKPTETTPPTKGDFPNASNTGVPPGITLSNYSGPCTITTAGTVIDGKNIQCDQALLIRASGVLIKNSKINGTLDSDSNTQSASVTVQDSEIDGGNATVAAVSSHDVKLLRVNVHGGKDSMQCNNDCEARDSWLHGQFIAPDSSLHLNGFISNGGTNMTLVHNTIACDAKITRNDGGCTSAIAVFGDFEPTVRFTFDNNLLIASESQSYCAYAGYDPGKPYAEKVANIVFTNNVFQRGANGKCGLYGAITSFNASKPGMVWKNNVWDDGKPLSP